MLRIFPKRRLKSGRKFKKAVGRRAAKSFKDLGVLGRGGISVVYRVEDRETGEISALKVIRPSLENKPKHIDRFRRECAVLSLIKDDNVVRHKGHSFGSFGGKDYLLMELMEGGSLFDELKERYRKREFETYGSISDSLYITVEVLKGLEAVHELGVVHRDIKPGNILLEGSKVKIGDFGICKIIGNEVKNKIKLSSYKRPRKKVISPGYTKDEGFYQGTPGYSSPEQNRSSDEIDGRSDVYSTGIVLYESLTGKHPFRDGDVPKPPIKFNPVISQKLSDLNLALLERNPNNRPTALEARLDLESF